MSPLKFKGAKHVFPIIATFVTLVLIFNNVMPSSKSGTSLSSHKSQATLTHVAVSQVDIFDKSGSRMLESTVKDIEKKANDQVHGDPHHDPNPSNTNSQQTLALAKLKEQLASIQSERDELLQQKQALKDANEHLQVEKAHILNKMAENTKEDPMAQRQKEQQPQEQEHTPLVITYTAAQTDTQSHTWDPYDTPPLEHITNNQLLRPKPQRIDPRYTAAVQWLVARQNRSPDECEKLGAVSVHLSDFIPGFPGVGALIQAFVMKAVAVVTKTTQVLIPEGHFRWYTNNSACNAVVDYSSTGSGINCYYRPLSNCNTKNVTKYFDVKAFENFTKRGTGTPSLGLLNKELSKIPHDDRWTFPPQLLNETGAATDINSIYNNGNIDQSRAKSENLKFAKQLWWGAIHGYILRLNKRTADRVARIRVRGGLAAIDIALHIRVGDKLTDPMSLQLVTEPKGPEYYYEQAATLARKIRSECAPMGPCAPVVVYVASDSRSAVELGYAWEARQNELMGENAVRVVAICSQTQVISTAAGTRGIDEDIRNGTKLGDKSSVAEEVIIDLSILQEARFFVGLCMSQMARAAVAIGLAQGTMEQAVAIDEENLVMWTPTKPAITKWDIPGYRGWRGFYSVDPLDKLNSAGKLELPELKRQLTNSPGPDSFEPSEPGFCLPSFKTSQPPYRDVSMYDNWITLVTVSGSFLRMFQNWLLFYIRLNLPVPLTVIAQDDKAYDWIQENMIGAITELKKAEELVKITVRDAFNSEAYNKLVTQRPTQILSLLKTGRHVMYVDIDSVLLRDPFPWFVGEKAHIWAANDAADKAKAGPFHACTGFLAIKSTEESIRLIELWATKMAEKLQRNQMVFNKVISDEGVIGNVVRFLPEPLFRRGKELKEPFVSKDLYQNHTISSEVAWIHANYLIGIIPKVMHLRMWGAWPLPL